MILEDLEAIIADRIKNSEKCPNSYTNKLIAEGENKVAQKVGEEAVEVVIEAVKNDQGRLTYEVADLIYHLTVLLTIKKLKWSDILKELESRHK